VCSFWRPGGPTRAVRRGAVKDVKSEKVGPLANLSWKEDWRGVRVRSGFGGGAALAKEREGKHSG
jgi:hypothetical protein